MRWYRQGCDSSALHLFNSVKALSERCKSIAFEIQLNRQKIISDLIPVPGIGEYFAGKDAEERPFEILYHPVLRRRLFLAKPDRGPPDARGQ